MLLRLWRNYFSGLVLDTKKSNGLLKTLLCDDDADSLAARVFDEECKAYPEAIRLFSEGRLKVANGVVKAKPM